MTEGGKTLWRGIGGPEPVAASRTQGALKARPCEFPEGPSLKKA